jgi:hypothetical protein
MDGEVHSSSEQGAESVRLGEQENAHWQGPTPEGLIHAHVVDPEQLALGFGPLSVILQGPVRVWLTSVH